MMNTNKYGLSRRPTKGTNLDDEGFEKIKNEIYNFPIHINGNSIFRTFSIDELNNLSIDLTKNNQSLLVYLGLTDENELILIFEIVNEEVDSTMKASGNITPPLAYKNNKQIENFTKEDAKKAFANLSKIYKPTNTKLQGFVWGNVALSNVANELTKGEELEIKIGWNGKSFEFYAIPSISKHFYRGFKNEGVFSKLCQAKFERVISFGFFNQNL